jgi:hypothetical protein
MKPKRKRPELIIRVVEENGKPEMYVVCDGVRIAKRGHPDTPQARTWVSLEPGFTVLDGPVRADGSGELIVEQNGVAIQ